MPGHDLNFDEVMDLLVCLQLTVKQDGNGPAVIVSDPQRLREKLRSMLKAAQQYPHDPIERGPVDLLRPVLLRKPEKPSS